MSEISSFAKFHSHDSYKNLDYGSKFRAHIDDIIRHEASNIQTNHAFSTESYSWYDDLSGQSCTLERIRVNEHDQMYYMNVNSLQTGKRVASFYSDTNKDYVERLDHKHDGLDNSNDSPMITEDVEAIFHTYDQSIFDRDYNDLLGSYLISDSTVEDKLDAAEKAGGGAKNIIMASALNYATSVYSVNALKTLSENGSDELSVPNPPLDIEKITNNYYKSSGRLANIRKNYYDPAYERLGNKLAFLRKLGSQALRHLK